MRMLEERTCVLELQGEATPAHPNAFLTDEKWRAAKSVTPLAIHNGTCSFVNAYVRDYLGAVCFCASLRSVFSLVSSDLSSVLIEMDALAEGGGHAHTHGRGALVDDAIRLLQDQNSSLQQQNDRIVKQMSLISIFAPRTNSTPDAAPRTNDMPDENPQPVARAPPRRIVPSTSVDRRSAPRLGGDGPRRAAPVRGAPALSSVAPGPNGDSSSEAVSGSDTDESEALPSAPPSPPSAPPSPPSPSNSFKSDLSCESSQDEEAAATGSAATLPAAPQVPPAMSTTLPTPIPPTLPTGNRPDPRPLSALVSSKPQPVRDAPNVGAVGLMMEQLRSSSWATVALQHEAGYVPRLTPPRLPAMHRLLVLPRLGADSPLTLPLHRVTACARS